MFVCCLHTSGSSLGFCGVCELIKLKNPQLSHVKVVSEFLTSVSTNMQLKRQECFRKERGGYVRPIYWSVFLHRDQILAWLLFWVWVPNAFGIIGIDNLDEKLLTSTVVGEVQERAESWSGKG